VTPICTKSFVGWLGLRPRPTGGAYSAPQLYLGGLLLTGGEGRGEEGREGKGREEERRGEQRRAEESRGEERDFVLCPRKKKEKSARMTED